MAVLVSFAGLSGSGKSTIARALSIATKAVYIRIDEIDAAIWALDSERDIGPESYYIAAALAVANLGLGHMVIVDCVNPWTITREIFIRAAQRAGVRLLRVETMCTDPALHKVRLAERETDIAGLKKTDWSTVNAQDYTPWDDADVRIDTATVLLEDAVSEIVRHL